MENKESKFCVYCGEKISASAEKCEHCGEWVDENSVSRNRTSYTYTSKNDTTEEKNSLVNSPNKKTEDNSVASSTINNINIGSSTEYSKILPIRRLFLLMILTFGIYGLYWIYKTNCYLRDDLGKDVSPGLRTFLMIIPIANIIVFYQTLDDMRNFIKQEGIETYSAGLNTLIMIFLGSIISFWVYINVQESINDLWRIKENNLPVRREFSNSEIVVMLLGAILWVCYFAVIIFASIISSMSGLAA